MALTCICGARVKREKLAEHIEDYHGRWSELRDWILKLLVRPRKKARRRVDNGK